MQDITVPAEAWQTAIDKVPLEVSEGRTGLVRSVYSRIAGGKEDFE